MSHQLVRTWYISVGDMPAAKAKLLLEETKAAILSEQKLLLDIPNVFLATRGESRVEVI
jgi:hypothetical protein